MVTATRVSIVTSVIVVALVIWGLFYAINNAYGDGFEDGLKSIEQAHHGSPAFADNGDDYSLMEPYQCTIRDQVTNFRDARGVCYSRNWERRKEVRDWNGAGDGGNTERMNFRGVFHTACAGENYKCGRASKHIK